MAWQVSIQESQQHVVLHNVPWAYYEQRLQEIGDQHIRVSFLDGVMEFMSPRVEHDAVRKAIADLIVILAMEFRIPRKSLGSTTFRREDKAVGAEPDECFYFHEIESVRGMKVFDPLLHRPPDLWLEVDFTSASLPREPIYARLGVPELWRYAHDRLTVRLLKDDGVYADSPTSRAFPLLPMDGFGSFILKMMQNDETEVLFEFRERVRGVTD